MSTNSKHAKCSKICTFWVGLALELRLSNQGIGTLSKPQGLGHTARGDRSPSQGREPVKVPQAELSGFVLISLCLVHFVVSAESGCAHRVPSR